MVANAFHARSKEADPIIILDFIERENDIFERVSEFTPIAVVHSKESPREIIERAATAGEFADQAIHIQPDEESLVVVILGALPFSDMGWL